MFSDEENFFIDDCEFDNSFCTSAEEIIQPIYNINISGSLELNVIPSSGASLLSNALNIMNSIVSHSTGYPNAVTLIIKHGVWLVSDPGNLWGGNAFYVAENGYSVNEVNGTRTIAFSLSRKAKIIDYTQGWKTRSRANFALQNGFDAIKYEGSLNLGSRFSYNLAIIKNPANLKPIGVYPGPDILPDTTRSAISLPMIRSLQVIGLIGTGVAIGNSVNQVIRSDSSLRESARQASLLVAAYYGGVQAGRWAILPCGRLGLAVPQAAAISVPICIATASLIGGIVATTGADQISHVLRALIDPAFGYNGGRKISLNNYGTVPQEKSLAKYNSNKQKWNSSQADVYKNVQKQACQNIFMLTRLHDSMLNSFRTKSYFNNYTNHSVFNINHIQDKILTSYQVRNVVRDALSREMQSMRPSVSSAYLAACSKIGLGYMLSYTEFRSVLASTSLIASYNHFNPSAKVRDVSNFMRDIGGVGNDVAQITDLLDSEAQAAAGEYYFCFPQDKFPVSKPLVRQMLRELADGYFTHKTIPFFSLHFNEKGFLYPVIHPAYQNTLIGEMIGFLDYWMKGFLNGGVFDDKFLNEWQELLNCDESLLRSKLIDLKKYCKESAEDISYISLRELMSRYGLKEKIEQLGNSEYSQSFTTSFRIIAYQEKIERHGNILIPHPSFRVEYSIDLMPDYENYLAAYLKENGCYPEDYQVTTSCYEFFAKEIKEKMPKLPFCADLFKLLGVTNAFCYFYATLKEMGKVPVLAKSMPHNKYFPKALPPIPVRYYQNHLLKITFADVMSKCDSQAIDSHLAKSFVGKDTKILSLELSQKIQQAILHIVTEQLFPKLPQEQGKEINEEEIQRIERFTSDFLLIKIKQISAEIKGSLKKLTAKLSTGELQQIKQLSLYSEKITKVQGFLKAHFISTKEAYDTLSAEVIDNWKTIIPQEMHVILEERLQKLQDEYVAALESITKEMETQALTILTDKNHKLLMMARRNEIMRVFEWLYKKDHALLEQYSKLINQCSQALLSIPQIASFPVSKQYTHTIMGFTSQNLANKTHDNFRIIGGCGMELPNIVSTPIENAENFILAVSSACSSLIEDITEFKFNAENYELLRLTVAEPVASLTEESTIILEDTFNTDVILSKNIQSNVLKNKMDDSGATMTHYGAMMLSDVGFKKFIAEDPKVIASADKFGNLPIHMASMAGNVDVVSELIKQDKTQLEIANKQGLTPLLLALQYGKSEVVFELLKIGANANYFLPNGLFPLYIALQNNFVDIASALLEHMHNTALNTQLDSGMTVLHLAIVNDCDDIAAALIKKGVNLNLKRKEDGYTALHLATLKGKLALIQVMVNCGASINLVLESQKTLLHVAALAGHIKVVEYLMTVAEMVDCVAQDGDTALMSAIKAGQVKVAIMLARAVKINTVNALGQTASMLALQYNMSVVSDILIARKEDLNLCNREGFSYLYYLVRNGEYNRFMSLAKGQLIDLHKKYDNQSLVTIAARYQHFMLVYALLEKGAEFLSIPDGYELIEYAIIADEIEFVREYLIENPLKASFASVAARHGSVRCLSLFLKPMPGDEIIAANLLFEAIHSRNEQIVDMILRHYKDVNQPVDEFGNTSLHIATSMGSRELIELLLLRGANILALNKAKETVFHLAIKQEDHYLLKRLFKLSKPELWPVNIWETNKDKKSVLSKVLTKYKERLPKNILAKKLLPAKSENKKLTVIESAEVNNLKELLSNAQFDSLAECLEENSALLQMFLGNRGGELLQNIFEQVYDFTNIKEVLNSERFENGIQNELLSQQIPYKVLASLQKAGVNPSNFLGKDNVLLAMLSATNDDEACYRLKIFTDYFADSLAILARDNITKLAIKQGFVKFFEKLDEKCVQDVLSENLFSGLHEAVLANNYKLVQRMLLRYPVDSLNNKKQTPLMLAAAHGNERIIELLLLHNAQLDNRCLYSRTALHYACLSKSEEAMLLLLPLFSKLSLTTKDRFGDSPLLIAAEKGILTVVRYLCDKYNCRQEVNNMGSSALHIAAKHGQIKVVEYLINNGFDVDQIEIPQKSSKNNKCLKRTALQLAILTGQTQIVLKLLELKADINKTDALGRDALYYVILSKDLSMQQLFQPIFEESKDKRQYFNLLCACAIANNTQILSWLIQKNIDLNAVDNKGCTLLHLCALYNAADVAELLVLGDDIDLDQLDNAGQTALHYAAVSGHVRIIEILASSYTDLNVLNSEKQTPLLLAVTAEKIGAVVALLKYEVEFTCNAENLTPAQVALVNGHIEIARRLVLAGDQSLQTRSLTFMPAKIKEKISVHKEFLAECREPKLLKANLLSKFGIYSNFMTQIKPINGEEHKQAKIE